jgi:hypothetical protein
MCYTIFYTTRQFVRPKDFANMTWPAALGEVFRFGTILSPARVVSYWQPSYSRKIKVLNNDYIYNKVHIER